MTTLHVFRKIDGEWIYIGDVDEQTKETTFSHCLPDDRICDSYPSMSDDCDAMITAVEAELL